jgi:hypothetical protein
MAQHHSQAEAEQMKRARAAETASAFLTTVKTWHCTTFPNCAAASTWLNLPPAQVAGEAFAVSGPNGQIILFFFL